MEETPPFLRAITTASMDIPGPFENVATEAYYNMTLPDPKLPVAEKNEFMMQWYYPAITNVSVHEVWPGHYLQFLYARDFPGDIRKVLIEAGVKGNRIVLTSYDPADSSASAPVRLSFVAVTAITGDCGQWPSDLFGPSIRDNTNWENFGCATQQNLAAQVANPADLVGPRGMTPIDAQRRAEVISIYRAEGNPAGD